MTTILVGVYLISERELTMGALIAAGMLAGRALAPAGQVVGLLMQYQGARTALESLDKLMAQPVERPGADDGAAPFIQRPRTARARSSCATCASPTRTATMRRSTA